MTLTEPQKTAVTNAHHVANNLANGILSAINTPVHLIQGTENVEVNVPGGEDIVVAAPISEADFVSIEDSINASKAKAILVCDQLKAYLESLPDL